MTPSPTKTLARIDVRMYHTGFGDCFLLSFQYGQDDAKPETKNMWIDFGSRAGDKDIMRRIAGDICARLPTKEDGSPYVDVLVITHEHEDHISGFVPPKPDSDPGPLANLAIRQLWFAWTEDLESDLAQDWRNYQNRARLTLQKAMTALSSSHHASPAQTKRLQNLFGFEVMPEDVTETETDHETSLGSGQNGSPTFAVDDKSTSKLGNKVYHHLRRKTKNSGGTIVYKRPGDLIEDAFPGVRIYVMGPPEDMAYVRRDQSSRPGEMYLQASYADEDYSLSRSLDVSPATTTLAVDKSMPEKDFWHYVRKAPFDEEFILPIPEANGKPVHFPQETYRTPVSEQYREQLKLLKQTAIYKSYTDKNNNWRSIDDDYLSSAENLAMRLNSATNNTSLVLAFEIEDTGEVLLFPGDAQYGVWLAWQEDLEKTQKDAADKKTKPSKAAYDENYTRKYQWTVKSDQEESTPTRTVSVEELLQRTILYKVGHHGSHNATPKRTGLEKLNPHLLALIPVDEVKAKLFNWDEIPYLNLLEALNQNKATCIRSDKLKDVKPTTDWSSQTRWKISYEREPGPAGSECLLCRLEPRPESAKPD